MKTQINNLEVYFGCSDILGVKHWSTNIQYRQYKLRFDFDEHELSNNNALEKTIDQKLLVYVVEHVLNNIDAIKSKATMLFTELHDLVYDDQALLQHQGYFQPEDIELKKVLNIGSSAADTVPYFEYEVHYSLESEIDFLIDIYYSYHARFSNYEGLTLIGAWRTG